jgi:hypothetical protein
MPSGAYMSPLLFLPARFGQDFPRIYEITEKPELLMEQITFHEAGHIYGDYLDYPEHDGFLSELIANIFSTAFIRAERPDLAYLLSGPPSKMKQQRYTSFADLEYLGGDVGMVNYGWFQFNVYRLTDLLLQRMNFAALLTTMRKLFPETDSPLFPEVLRRLESIRPGITAELGPLAKPTTIPKIPFGSCVEANMSGKPSSLVVENLSREKVTIPSGRRRSQDITPLTWRKIDGHVGEVLHIGPTRCWHFADEPSIAEIQP